MIFAYGLNKTFLCLKSAYKTYKSIMEKYCVHTNCLVRTRYERHDRQGISNHKIGPKYASTQYSTHTVDNVLSIVMSWRQLILLFFRTKSTMPSKKHVRKHRENAKQPKKLVEAHLVALNERANILHGKAVADGANDALDPITWLVNEDDERSFSQDRTPSDHAEHLV